MVLTIILLLQNIHEPATFISRNLILHDLILSAFIWCALIQTDVFVQANKKNQVQESIINFLKENAVASVFFKLSLLHVHARNSLSCMSALTQPHHPENY